MDLLFKRQQTSSRFLKVTFKLWGKIELNEDEQAVVRRYSLGDAFLIEDFQPKLLRNSALIGVLAFMVGFFVFAFMPDPIQWLLSFAAGGAAGYWFFHENRQTIYVKDLLHGRNFACRSIVALAQKEKWLENQVSIFRQIMETAKHWDDTETIDIPVLPKKEAKELVALAA